MTKQELEEVIAQEVTSRGWGIFQMRLDDSDLLLSIDQGTAETRKATYLPVESAESILSELGAFIDNPIVKPAARFLERPYYSRVS